MGISFFNTIREHVDIVDLISNYLNLKRTGSNFKGLCPFHNEKTPSFVVSPQKQIFHCFGCGKGGDVIKFISEIEGIEYYDAAIKIARDYNIPIKFEKKSSITNFFEITEFVANIFHKNLLENLEKVEIKNFIEKRKLSADIIEKFFIGYAPDRFDFILNKLKEKGIDIKLAENLGIIKKKKDYYDIFRNRIIFPIRNLRGDFIAFGGRTLNDEVMPKYLNSPETPIFHKRKNLYGLYENKDNIKKENEVIVVEGYMDLISLTSYGVNNCVANLGTAFSNEQLKLINRFVENIIFLYDSDNAGIKASIRSSIIAINSEVIPKLILLPKGLDPDDFIKKEGRDKFIELKNNAYDLIDFLKKIIFLQIDLKNFENKNRLMKRLKNIFLEIDNPIYKDHFIKGVSEILEINFNDAKKYFSKHTYFSKKENNLDEKGQTKFNIEDSFVAFLLTFQEYLDDIELSFFENDFNKKIINHLKENKNIEQLFELKDFNETDKTKLRELILQEFSFPDTNEKEKWFNDYKIKLKKRYLDRLSRELTLEIRKKEKENNNEALEELMRKKKDIDRERLSLNS